MAPDLTPQPESIWEPSTMMEEQIQSLVTSVLLKPMEEVGWRPAACEAFPIEGTSETAAFLIHIECRFGVPTGDFFHGLFHYYHMD